jgi:hypothetical protein
MNNAIKQKLLLISKLAPEVIYGEQPAEWVEAKGVFHASPTDPKGIVLLQILPLEERVDMEADDLFVTTFWLSVVDHKTVQLIVDQHLLAAKEKVVWLRSKLVLVNKSISLSGDLSQSLGLKEAPRLKAKAYTLKREGHYFHHFLDFMLER